MQNEMQNASTVTWKSHGLLTAYVNVIPLLQRHLVHTQYTTVFLNSRKLIAFSEKLSQKSHSLSSI